jgi:membrane-associated phospholipid phosphatase
MVGFADRAEEVLRRVRPEEGLFAVFATLVVGLHFALGEPLAVPALARDAWAASLAFRWVVAAGAAVLASLSLACLTVRGRAGAAAAVALRSVRDFLPFGFMYLLYESVHALGPRLHGAVFDPLLARVDFLLFRTQAFISVPVGLFEQEHYQLFAFFLAFCYSAVFIVYWGLAFYFFFCFSRRTFRRYMLAVVSTSFLGYAFYLLCPAVGPYEAFVRADLTEFASWTRFDGAQAIASFADTIRNLHVDRTAACDAFPSLHTAWALLALGFAARHAAWLLWVLVPWAFGTVFGAVYFQQHYLIDILAGIPAAAIGCLAANWLTGFEVRDDTDVASRKAAAPLRTQ